MSQSHGAVVALSLLAACNIVAGLDDLVELDGMSAPMGAGDRLRWNALAQRYHPNNCGTFAPAMCERDVR